MGNISSRGIGKVQGKVFVVVGIIASSILSLYANREETVATSNAESAATGQPITAPYGSWQSPLSAASIFESSDNIAYLSGGEEALHFIESRASANGRNVLVKLDAQHNIHPLTAS